MNYYNPYFNGIPYSPAMNNIGANTASKGFLGNLFSGGKITNFINGTQKTLNIINQAIPLVKEVSPVMKNAKTMFRVMNEFKKVDKPTLEDKTNLQETNTMNYENLVEENRQKIQKNSNVPTFFL